MVVFPNVPNTPDRDLVGYISALHKVLGNLFNSRPPVTEPRNAILLVSPSGAVYTVTVTDAGILNTELIG